MKNLAERLKQARERRQWSQAQLAAASGLSQSTIGNIEAGTRMARGSLPELAKALGISYEWLANNIGDIDTKALAAPIAYTGPSSLGRELALVFDMIPETDALKRAKAFALATSAIVAVLQGEAVTLARVQDR